jgi:hypothetical protein
LAHIKGTPHIAAPEEIRYNAWAYTDTVQKRGTKGDSMQIAGSVAVITGGASGLGAANARILAEAGAKVAILDVNTEAGITLAATYGKNG